LHLLTHFPFTTNAGTRAAPLPQPTATITTNSRPKEELKARKAEFRTLSKERREALQTEYVEYRDALMRRIATSAPPDNAPESIKPAGKARSMASHDTTKLR
jgi:hypothetical protein